MMVHCTNVIRMTDMDILTSPEAGQILHMSARTVQRMADRGELEYIRKLPGPNGAYIFHRSVIEAAARVLSNAAS